jgi:hypothetical protein
MFFLWIRPLISNNGRFKPAFTERDKKQTMIDLRGISTNWLKNQLYLSIRILGYTVKEVSGFSVPSQGMSLTKLSLAGNN